MHRTKKMTLTSAVVALLLAAGASSAMAAHSDDNGNDEHKVTICHATHSAKNPFVRIHVSKNSDKAHGHAGHEGDTIVDDDADVAQCQPAPGHGDDHEVTIGHFVSAGHYERIHTTEDDDAALTLHGGHENDEIIRDEHDFWQCPKSDDGDADNDEDNGNCSATSTSGNQVGLVNVQADNLASNVLCQSEILNYLTVSVLGSSLGSGALGGGSGGLLSGPLTANIDVLARVLVLF